MKLTYIVNIDLTSAVARAIQVRAMANEFYTLLNKDFKCFVAKKDITDKQPFNQIFTLGLKESNILRKIIFILGSLKEIKNSDLDTIIYSRNIIIVYIASLFGKKSAWELHDSLSTFNSFLLKRINNLTIIAISQALIDYYNQTFLEEITSKGLIQYIILARSGVYIENYDKYKLNPKRKMILLEQFNLPMDKIIILHSGSLYPGRGAELFEIILKNFKDIYFLQIGGNESDIKYWQQKYSKYNNIEFIPNQPNNKLIEYQLCADLLFLPMTKQSPIWKYTSPMKAFEYMATQIPILCSNIGSVSEILDNTNSIIFNYEDENSLIKAIKWYEANPKQAQELALKAYNDVKEYTWNKRAKYILSNLK